MSYPNNYYPPPTYPPVYPPMVNETGQQGFQNVGLGQPISQPGMYPQIPSYPPYPAIDPYPPVYPPMPPGGIYLPPSEFVVEPTTTPCTYPYYPGNINITQPSYPSAAAPIGQAVGPPYSSGYPDPIGTQYSYPFQQRYQPVNRIWNYKMPQGTVKYFEPFAPEADAQVLRKAMKGLGTDEAAIIEVLAHRTNFQRQQISVAYKTLYGRDLVEDLNSELSGRFEDVINAVMTPLTDYIAKELRHALSGAGTDEDVLIEILCTRENREILEIKDAYKRLFDRSLEDDLASDTSGDFRRLIISMSTGARSDDFGDPDLAKQDANELFEAGENQWGTDESVFNRILAARSWDHLGMVFYEYEQIAGHNIIEAVEREFSGDVKQGWLTVVKTVIYRPAFFAERIYKAMRGAGTEDRDLIRLIVTRSEKDMVQIKQEYQNQYEKTLEEAIEGDTSGDYKRMLIGLVAGM